MPSETAPEIIPAPQQPSRTPSETGGVAGSPWTNHTSKPQQPQRPGTPYGSRDARTGFLIDAATGYPIHPKTGLLIEPGTGRLLVRGSLEPSDFIYDQASHSVKLSIQDQGSAPASAGSGSSQGTGVGGTNVAAAGSPSTGAAHAQTTSEHRSSLMGLASAPSAPAVILGILLALGGVWYFFVFVRQPRAKPTYRR